VMLGSSLAMPAGFAKQAAGSRVSAAKKPRSGVRVARGNGVVMAELHG
jgi:hypothetical protein